MICPLCGAYYKENDQSPVCPHSGTTREPAPGGPVLRPEIKRDIDEAYRYADRETLKKWACSPNFAAAYYADLMLRQLDTAKPEVDGGQDLQKL